MTKIIYVAADGQKTEVEARDGDSVMQTAVNHDVDGIVGECGGSMACATCHVYVDDAWAEKLSERSDGEGDLLECAASEEKPTSRLSCQIVVRPELGGLIVHMPEAQI